MNLQEHPIFYSLMVALNFAVFAKEIRRWPKRASAAMWVKATICAILWPAVCAFLLGEAYLKAWRGER